MTNRFLHDLYKRYVFCVCVCVCVCVCGTARCNSWLRHLKSMGEGKSHAVQNTLNENIEIYTKWITGLHSLLLLNFHLILRKYKSTRYPESITICYCKSVLGSTAPRWFKSMELHCPHTAQSSHTLSWNTIKYSVSLIVSQAHTHTHTQMVAFSQLFSPPFSLK